MRVAAPVARRGRRPEARAPRPRRAGRRRRPPPRPASAAAGRGTTPGAPRALRVLSVPLSSSSGSTIEPERPRLDRVDVEVRLAPGIACEGCADGVFGLGLDGVHDALLVRERPAEDDEAV